MVPASKTDRGFLREAAPVILIGLVFIGLAALLRTSWAAGLFQSARNWFVAPHAVHALDLPWVNAAVFILAGGFLIGVGVPRLWVSALAGAVYGLLAGTVLGLAASTIGASVVYAAGWGFLSGRVMGLSGYSLAHWRARFQENAFLWVLYLRLFPLSNATAAGLLSGSCRVPFLPYMAGSVLGFIPMALVMTFLGEGSVRGSYVRIMAGIACLAILHIILYAGKRIRLKAGTRNPDSEGSSK
ncbi:MAG: VTT domain-containing protein [Pseudomonadota bacterium]